MNKTPIRVRALGWVLAAAAAVLGVGCGEEAPQAGGSSPPPAPAAAPAPAPDAGARYQAAVAAVGPETLRLAGFIDTASAAPRLRPEAAREGVTWARLANALVDAQPAIRDVLAAAAEDRAAFPSALAEAPAGVLFTGQCRGLYRLLRADAGRLLAEGKGDEAAERLGAILGLCRHMAQQEELIYGLVAVAVLAGVQDSVDVLFGDAAADRLTPNQRRTLLAALERLNADDPCGMAAARAREKAVDGPQFASSEQQARTRFEALRARLGAK